MLGLEAKSEFCPRAPIVDLGQEQQCLIKTVMLDRNATHGQRVLEKNNHLCANNFGTWGQVLSRLVINYRLFRSIRRFWIGNFATWADNSNVSSRAAKWWEKGNFVQKDNDRRFWPIRRVLNQDPGTGGPFPLMSRCRYWKSKRQYFALKGNACRILVS